MSTWSLRTSESITHNEKLAFDHLALSLQLILHWPLRWPSTCTPRLGASVRVLYRCIKDRSRRGPPAKRFRRHRARSVLLNEIVSSPAKLLDVRARMSGDNLCAGSFPCIFALPQIPASHGPSSAGLVVFEGTEGISAHFRLVATLMDYPIVIRYVRGAENSIADALSQINSITVNNEVPNELARGVPPFACPVAEVDRLDARIDWIAEQQSDETIAIVTSLLKRNARPEPVDIENFPPLKLFSDVWLQLTIEDDLLKHCNERAVSTRIVVPAALREQVFRSLHESRHHGYKASLQRIAQRFWWFRVRTDVSAFVKACKVCDRDRSSNPAVRSHLEHLPSDQPFAVLLIDIVGGQNSLSLVASPKSILIMIDGLTGWVEAIPIPD